MDTVYDLLSRAKKLSEKNQVNSITPEEVGKLHEDTLAYIASFEQSADALGVKRTYKTTAEMEADEKPLASNGKPIRYGQLCVVRGEDSNNGNIYAYQKPGWLLIGSLNEGHVVDDLSTGGRNVPLSAEQGKILSKRIEGVSDVEKTEALNVEWTAGEGYTSNNGITTNSRYSRVDIDLGNYTGKYILTNAQSYDLYIIVVNLDGTYKAEMYKTESEKAFHVTSGMKTLRICNRHDLNKNPYVKVKEVTKGVVSKFEQYESVLKEVPGLIQANMTHNRDVTFDWKNGSYYDAGGILRTYATPATRYSSCEIDLTKYVGKTITCKFLTYDSDVVRSVIVRSDGSVDQFNNPNGDVKDILVTGDMQSLRMSNYNAKLITPYAKTRIEVKGSIERLNELDAQVNGYLDEIKEVQLAWIADEYYSSDKATISTYPRAGRKQRTTVDLTKYQVGSELHILSYSDSSRSYQTYSLVLTKSGRFETLVLSPAREFVYKITEKCDTLYLSDDTTMGGAHTPYVKLKAYNQGLKDKANGGTSEKDKGSKDVDLFIFMGQSNMAGRGIVTAEHPEDAPQVVSGAGYEFRAISNPTRIYPITKTFGVAENIKGAIDDGNKKTGGLVPSFVNSYYKVTGVPIIAVSASIGGTPSASFKQGGAIFNDAVNRLTLTKNWLRDNGYKILHTYMVWCQGESDGDNNVTKDTYKSNFADIFNGMKVNGVEKCFLIRIGEDNGTDKDYTAIMNAQNDVCKESADVVMVSLDFQSMLGRGLMKDNWHYFQKAYNEVGATAGYHAGVYRMYNREDVMYDPKNDNLFYTRWSR